jgi:branched-chain amino acid transport system permease protein
MKSSRVLNIAHGQIIAAGAFITYALTVWINILIHLLFHQHGDLLFGHERGTHLLRRLIGEPIISVIMVTIGLDVDSDGIIYLTPSAVSTTVSIFPQDTVNIDRPRSPGPSWWE